MAGEPLVKGIRIKVQTPVIWKKKMVLIFFVSLNGLYLEDHNL